jgi:hypothetical protein
VKPQAFPVWLYLLVALAIAGIGFMIAQLVEGGGMFFVIPATTAWTVIAMRRQCNLVRK